MPGHLGLVVHSPAERDGLLRSAAARFGQSVAEPEKNIGWLPTSSEYALWLLETGGASEATEASRIIRKLLATQYSGDATWTDMVGLRRGNYRKGWGDPYPYDLNVSCFHMLSFVPICRRHGGRIGDDLRSELLDSMHEALRHIHRRNVHLPYTNITLMECSALICGGELVGRDDLHAEGITKLEGWLKLVARTGIREYNSTAYLAPDLVSVATVREFSSSPKARLMGRLAEERLWWHVASHFHPETLQWSPPHSRTYAADAVGGPSGLKWIVYKETGIAGLVDPDLRGALESQNLVADVSRWTDATIWKGPAKKPSSLANPANAARAVMCRFRLPEHVAGRFYTPSEHSMTVERTQPHQDILSYRTRRYTVGCVNHGFQNPHKGNLFVWYTAKPGYVLPHRLLYTEFCRRQNTRSTPLGYSAACGDRGRYIILYSVFSGKEEIEFPEISVDLVVPDRSQPDELWCGGGPVAELPADLPVNGPLFIREGGVYFAIRPIPLADLGRPSPFTASDDRGDLQVSIWAYRGEARSFGDELRGRALAGYLLEVGDEEEYGSFDAFRETVRAGRLDVAVEGRRVQVRHAAGSDSMSLEWDPSILANETYRTEVPVSLPLAAVRRVRGRLIEPPVLDDPWGQIRAGGPIVVGGAALAPTPEPVGLWATPEGDACSLWQPHPSGMPVHLSTAVAEVRCPSFPMGILVLKREDGGVALEIEAAERVGLLRARPIGVAGLRATVAGVSAKAVAATGVPGQEGWLEIRQVGDES